MEHRMWSFAAKRVLSVLGPLLEPGEEPQFAAQATNLWPPVEAFVITDRRVALINSSTLLKSHHRSRSLWFSDITSWDALIAEGRLRIDLEDGTSFTIKGISAREVVAASGVMKRAMGASATGLPTKMVTPHQPEVYQEQESTPAIDLVAQLEGLASLHEVGALSDEEFERAKLRILES